MSKPGVHGFRGGNRLHVEGLAVDEQFICMKVNGTCQTGADVDGVNVSAASFSGTT
ncbi:MAG: hypothetical protein U0Q11_25365 [Vicinamibacterales bacterium]